MSIATANRKYLRDLVERELMPIPTEVALQAGIRLFMKMIWTTQIDSGQAAANWQLLPYRTEPKRRKQEIYWGYESNTAVHPFFQKHAPGFPGVGFKAWTDPDKRRGDLATIANALYDEGESAIVSAPNRIKGVLVFNPITPGFPGFRPGSDANYERNALEMAYVDMPAAAKLALNDGARAAAVRYRALKVTS